MIPQQFDIVIVGSGLAGSALACALGGLGLRVALIEAQPLSLQWPALTDDVNGFDARVSALTESSRTWLEQLGAWPLVAARRLSPYREMEVWDGEGTGAIHFHAEEVNQPTLGHIVENGLLQTALLHALQNHRDVQVLSPVRVSGFERRADGGGKTGVVVRLEDQRELSCKLLIGADGANSRVRDWAGLKLREWDYGHTAIVATVQTELPHGASARQIFRRQGPLALLPLRGSLQGTADDAERFCSIVWSTSPDEADALMALDDTAFAATLGEEFQYKLGAITATSQRFSFPLKARHAVDYVADNVALIGDAAHTIHPLAGQGINLGFLDAQALAQEIRRAVQRGLDPADAQALARYQRRRKGDNWAVLGAMEGFKRLFGTTALLPRLLRNTGMNAFDRIEPIKRLLIRQAMRIGPG